MPVVLKRLASDYPNIYENYITWKSDISSGRKQWMSRSTESEEIYHNDVDGTGTLFTRTELERINDVTGIPVSINFIYPVLNQKLAILAQTKPSTKILPIDPRSKTEAIVLDKMKHGVFYNSNASVEIENAIKDMLVTGMGCLMVTDSSFYQEGMFNLLVSHVPYDEVILDINAKKRTLDDMEGFFLEKAITIPKFIELYRDILFQLKDENGAPIAPDIFTAQTWIEGELTEKQDVSVSALSHSDRIIIREYYTKVLDELIVFNGEDGQTQLDFLSNYSPEIHPLLSTRIIEKRPGVYIKKVLIAGDHVLFEEILPITEYPLVAMFYEWGGKPYLSYGMPHFTKDMQAALDKAIQNMILNGILTNNAGWIAPKGAIAEQDRKKWEEFGANPMVIKEYNPVVRGDTNEVLKPEKEDVGQLSNFYPTLIEMFKTGIEFSTGITPVLQGDPRESNIEVFSSLQQYQNAAMMRIILATMRINTALQKLTDVLVQLMIARLKPDSYEFFDDKGQINELKIALDLANSIKRTKFRVVSMPAVAMPTQRLAVSMELMKIAQSSPDPSERSVLTQKAMELTDIREVDDIMQRIDAVKRAQSELASLRDAYDRLMETSKQIENKYINVSLENRVLKQLAAKETAIAESYAKVEAELSIASKIAQGQIKGEKEKDNK